MKKYNDIRNTMLNEGLYDPNIFKVFFLAGGPGSGKSYVSKDAFAGTGLKFSNSDRAFEYGMKKAGLDLKMPDEEQVARDIVRDRAKAATSTELSLAIRGRLGLVIDGTGHDYAKVQNRVQQLRALGYDCYMVFVNTSLDVALQRNIDRGNKGDRTVPEYIAKTSWQNVQNNIGKFQNLFGVGNFLAVDNSSSDEERTGMVMRKVTQVVRRMLSQPVKNWTAKKWMALERQKKREMFK